MVRLKTKLKEMGGGVVLLADILSFLYMITVIAFTAYAYMDGMVKGFTHLPFNITTREFAYVLLISDAVRLFVPFFYLFSVKIALVNLSKSINFVYILFMILFGLFEAFKAVALLGILIGCGTISYCKAGQPNTFFQIEAALTIVSVVMAVVYALVPGKVSSVNLSSHETIGLTPDPSDFSISGSRLTALAKYRPTVRAAARRKKTDSKSSPMLVPLQ